MELLDRSSMRRRWFRPSVANRGGIVVALAHGGGDGDALRRLVLVVGDVWTTAAGGRGRRLTGAIY